MSVGQVSIAFLKSTPRSAHDIPTLLHSCAGLSTFPSIRIFDFRGHSGPDPVRTGHAPPLLARHVLLLRILRLTLGPSLVQLLPQDIPGGGGPCAGRGPGSSGSGHRPQVGPHSAHPAPLDPVHPVLAPVGNLHSPLRHELVQLHHHAVAALLSLQVPGSRREESFAHSTALHHELHLGNR